MGCAKAHPARHKHTLKAPVIIRPMQTPTRRAALFVALLTLPLLAPADGERPSKPKSAQAKPALRKYDDAAATAQRAYERALATARKERQADLDKALKAAMRAGSLEEAKAIEAAAKEIAHDAAAPNDEAAVKDVLLGTWVVVASEPSEWTFLADGTVRSNRNGPNGVWRLEKGHVMIRWNESQWETFEAPIHPAGVGGATHISPTMRVHARKSDARPK